MPQLKKFAEGQINVKTYNYSMNIKLYETSRYMNFVMKGNTSPKMTLVSVILGFNYFLLNIYKTLSNTCICIKILQIQCKYIIQ